jgi:hypothetical protein
MNRGLWITCVIVGALVACVTQSQAAPVTVSIAAKATGTAKKGEYTRNGMKQMTGDKQLADAAAYVLKYNGDTTFDAVYDITLGADKKVDSSKSTVKFITKTFSDEGTEAKSNFMTLPITITDVTLMGGDATMIASFKFDSTDWYPPDATGANGLINMGLSGMIDLKSGDSSYLASYAAKNTGAIYMYMVSGKIKPPAPFPDPLPDDFGDPEMFTPAPSVPEPASIPAMVLALASITSCRRTKAANRSTS